MAELQLFELPQPSAPGRSARGLIHEEITDAAVVEQAETLQRWLNTFPGVFTKIDGVPGKGTSDAFHVVTGRYLPGDPRA